MLFLPGQEIVGSRRSRSEGVLDRILALSDAEVGRQLAATLGDTCDTSEASARTALSSCAGSKNV